MRRKMELTKQNSKYAGGCSNCNLLTRTLNVSVIKLGNVEIRVCGTCKKELIALLKRR